MATLTIQEAQSQPSDLIHRLTLGDEVVITEDNQPVARIAPGARFVQRKPRQPAHCGGPCCTWRPTSTRRWRSSRSTWNEAPDRLPIFDLVRRSGPSAQPGCSCRRHGPREGAVVERRDD